MDDDPEFACKPRHHRLLELYLLEVLGYSWDEVHDEAEKLEHHIS